MKRIVVIGSGNVAEALVRAFCRAGNPPVQIFARDRDKAMRVSSLCGCPFTDVPEELAEADMYVIAVSDRAIRQVAVKLNFGDTAVVAHTAGSVGLDVFPQEIRNRAVFYPLQTFTKGRDVDFRDVPLLVEANNPYSLETVRGVAETVSDKVSVVDSEKRMQIHCAAVFVNNFANYMYTIGEELIKDAGLDFSMLKPLLRETADKALDAASPRDVQTGPAVRNDFETRSKHIEMLMQKPLIKNMYINISNNIWETSKKI